MSKPARGAASVIQELVLLLVLAVALALGIKTFVMQAFYIPSGSMEPGLTVDDRILVEKVGSWLGGEPDRGDVVVFDDPGGWLDESESAGPTGPVTSGLAKLGLYPTGGHLVKRVIGVPGDTVSCCDRQGRISINGQPLDEDDFIDPQSSCDGPMAGCRRGWSTEVPANSIFVMGDNRDESADSSYHLCPGPLRRCDPASAYVPIDQVVGKVFAVIWPLDHAKFEHRPDVFETVPDPS